MCLAITCKHGVNHGNWKYKRTASSSENDQATVTWTGEFIQKKNLFEFFSIWFKNPWNSYDQALVISYPSITTQYARFTYLAYYIETNRQNIEHAPRGHKYAKVTRTKNLCSVDRSTFDWNTSVGVLPGVVARAIAVHYRRPLCKFLSSAVAGLRTTEHTSKCDICRQMLNIGGNVATE